MTDDVFVVQWAVNGRMEAGGAKNGGNQLHPNESAPLQLTGFAAKCAPVSV